MPAGLMRVALLVVATATLLVGVATGAGSGTSTSATTVIDRTFICTNAVRDGMRKLEANASRGFKEPARWKFLASAGVSNHGTDRIQLPPNNKGLVGNSDTNWYVNALAGRGTPPPLEEGGGHPNISVATRGCSPSSARVLLSTRGLSGGEAGYFDDGYECAAPRRVLVRIRGVFRGAASLRLDRLQGALKVLRATGDLTTGSFAVRTLGGKSIAFGMVTASGKATLFTNPSCVAD
ncbi:MAG: hypothetical protein H0V68_09920 [Actinobacteria bacterium]|nr:hypothetical protein [Actinomycetota bacterium]